MTQWVYPGSCYGSSLTIYPEEISHIFKDPSMPPEATHLPSGDIATSLTSEVCSANVKTSWLFLYLKSQIFTVWSFDEVAIILIYSS